MKAKRLLLSFTLGLGLSLALLWGLTEPGTPAMEEARAAFPLDVIQRPVSNLNVPAAELYVCPSGCAYSSVQAAVDAAGDGDVVKVAAGTYTGVSARTGVTQVVYISKTVTIRGGYVPTNWTVSFPVTQPTTLDAQEKGRVLYVTGEASPTVTGLRITGGNAAGLGGGPWGYADAGGGVYAVDATVMLIDSQVFGNHAHHGGGLGVVNASVAISDSHVFSNVADGDGGGVYVINAVEDEGDGADVIRTTVAIEKSQIFDNVATGGDGGGVYVDNVMDEYVDYLGRIAVVMNDNWVFDNAAHQGSGGGLYLSNAAAVLEGNTIATNDAAYSGGGVFLSRCLFCSFPDVAALDGNTFAANRAGWDGGGLYLGQSAMLDNNFIFSNTAEYGGGLFARFSNNTFTNTVIVDNQADVAGSGLGFAGSQSRLLHTTIARNRGGDGSGILLTWLGTGSILAPNILALTNTIVASHTVGITMTEAISGIDMVTLAGVLWFGNEVDIAGTTSFTVTRASSGDPAFAADGYHLTVGSAAIDRGVDGGVTTDVDGEARPGEGCDLGADEFPLALRVTKTATPDPVRPGHPLTYTIRVTNTGSVDLCATITDTLPYAIESGRTSGGTVVWPGESITWTATILVPGGAWAETVVVTVAQDYVGKLTNVVQVTTKEGAAGGDSAVVDVGGRLYLPLVVQSGEPVP